MKTLNLLIFLYLLLYLFLIQSSSICNWKNLIFFRISFFCFYIRFYILILRIYISKVLNIMRWVKSHHVMLRPYLIFKNFRLKYSTLDFAQPLILIKTETPNNMTFHHRTIKLTNTIFFSIMKISFSLLRKYINIIRPILY